MSRHILNTRRLLLDSMKVRPVQWPSKEHANASNPIAEGIVGTANEYTAAICKMTNNSDKAVCSLTKPGEAKVSGWRRPCGG
jgi:hypothetical protein